MKATQEDRAFPKPQAKRSKLWLALSIAFVILIAGTYLLLKKDSPELTKIPQPISQTEEAPQVELPEIPTLIVEEPGFILPVLEESDGEFRTHLIDISDQLAPWLQFEELIRRGVSFVDGLSKGEVLTKQLSLPPPTGTFLVSQIDDKTYLSDENYARYDLIESLISSLNGDKIAPLFHTFRPLLEQAYGELGYQPDSFDAAVIFTLDEILATPIIDKPLELKQESVYYTFAEPEIEQLSSVQKQLIRMGPEMTKLLQKKAATLRNSLLTAQQSQEQTPNGAIPIELLAE